MIPWVGQPVLSIRAYQAIWSMEVQTSTKRSLMETQWPLLQRRFSNGCIEMINLEKRSGDIGPFRFQMRQDLAATSEDEVIASCLRLAGGMRIWATWDASNQLSQLRGVSQQRNCNARQVLDFVLLPATDGRQQFS